METIQHILERVKAKKISFAKYNFAQIENSALTTFFDLAQEFDAMDDFYRLCVSIPKAFFDRDACLYLIDPKGAGFALVAYTGGAECTLYASSPQDIRPGDRPYHTDRDSLVLTIRGKKDLIDQLPFATEDNVIGFLEVYPIGDMNQHHKLFFEKYANRIGFNIHNRFLVEKNLEHLRFIRSLVGDIEHNIIAPNMIYKLFLKHLRKKIMKNRELEGLLAMYLARGREAVDPETLMEELREVNRGLFEELENIEKHYQHMSLFLETLLRRSHFDRGQLTLIKKPCNIKKDVVQPQLDRFAERFRQMGIHIDDRLSGIPDEDVISVVDVGLIAQVYANFFTNALKYTREVLTHSGEKLKYISYGREVLGEYFGPGKDGIKYNVFSTGPHISPEEREQLFEDEFRGSNAQDRPGTGHGLYFVKNVVEIHGGTAGYEPTQYGNNFFFIIPK